MNRVVKRSVVLALVVALIPISASPSNATPCYVVVGTVLTDGSGCSGDVVIEEGITEIGQYNGGYGAFQESGVTSVIIPASVETILYGAFWYRTGLTSVTFASGSNLLFIDRFAFASTPNLKSISLPSSVNSISSVAFNGSGINYITFEGAPPTVVNYNGPGNFQGVSFNAIAWVKPENLAAFNAQTPTILPNIRSLSGSTPPPSIYSPSNGATLSAAVGIYFYREVSFFGVGNPILEVSSGSLPPGINFNASTGILSGTPTTTPPLVTRTYPVSLRVRDGVQSESVSISFEVDPPPLPTINDENFSGYVGIPMNKELSIFALGEETVSLSEGSLPPGVSINSSNRIAGTPTTAGTYSAKLTVTDSYSQSATSNDFVFEIKPSVNVSISASRTFMNPTDSLETHLDSVITTNAPNDFIICGFYKDAKDSGGVYQRDNCQEKQFSGYISDGISSNINYSYSDFDNTTWVIRVYGPDASADGNPNINTPFLATVTLKVSQEDLYRNWLTPLPAITNGPTVRETIYASAFERELPRTLFKNVLDYRANTTDYPTPEEYVYRITKQPNVPATSVDHQPYDAYESLTIAEQSNWYTKIEAISGYAYEFTWKAFMCVNEEDYSLTKPTALNRSYASREDGVLSGGSFNAAHNMMFKNEAIDWHQNAYLGQTTRSAVGYFQYQANDVYSRSIQGESDPAWHSHIWGILDIEGTCTDGTEFQALTILNSSGSPVITKSFEIPEELRLDLPGSNTLVSPSGITIGVTGVASRRDFNAALWGLTTIANSNSTPPSTTPPSTTPPSTTPPSTTPPAPTPTPTPTPTIASPTNAPAAVASKPTTSSSASMQFLTSSTLLSKAHKAVLKKSVAVSGKKATYVITGVAGFLPGVTEAQVKKLATVRANIVKAYLVKLGVKKANITIKIKTTNQGIVPKTKILARYLAN